MRGAPCFLFIVCVALFCVLDAAPNGRKSQVRYLNSMPQFGKAKLTAWSPPNVMFDQVPQGYLTDYSSIEAQVWNFTAVYTTNVTAGCLPVDLDSDTYATVYTYQAGPKKLMNKVIYDTSRSTSVRKGLLRTVNLALYNYTVRVYNDSGADSDVLFNSVTYGAASNYKEVDPGEYDFRWSTVDSDLKRNVEQGGNSTSGGGGRPKIVAGRAYTLFISPLGNIFIQDGKKKTRSVNEELASITAEVAPQSESVKEANKSVKEEEKGAVELKDQEKNINNKVNAKRDK